MAFFYKLRDIGLQYLTTRILGERRDGCEINIHIAEHKSINGDLHTAALCGEFLKERVFRNPVRHELASKINYINAQGSHNKTHPHLNVCSRSVP